MGLSLGVTLKDDLARVEDAMDRLTEFADEVVADRRRNPVEGDTVAHLMASHDDGKLSEEELRETLVNMFFGGVETTRNQLGIAIRPLPPPPRPVGGPARAPGAGARRGRGGHARPARRRRG